MLMITARLPPFIKPVVGATGRTLSFKQFPNGTVLIGGGMLGRASPDENRTELDFTNLAINARTVWDLFPIMRSATVVRAWAGIEARMPDQIPVIGPSGTELGVYHAFGFSAHGFQLGPIVGRIHRRHDHPGNAPPCRSRHSASSGSTNRRSPPEPSYLPRRLKLPIQRVHPGPRMSEMVIHNETVYLSGQIADDGSTDVESRPATCCARSTPCWRKPARTRASC